MIFSKKHISIFLLLIPNVLRWMPFRTFSLTINCGIFPFFWPAVFYLLYYFMTHRSYANKQTIYIRKIFICAFILSPFILVLNEEGRYAMDLWLQNLIFYIIIFSFLYHTPTIDQLNFIKKPIYFLYFYILIQMVISCLGLYQFNNTDSIQNGMNFIRASTKAGDSNQTSIILFILSAIITGYYSDRVKFNIIILSLTLVVIAMGATRGPLIASTIYFVIYFYYSIRNKSLTKKIIPTLLIVAIIWFIVQYNIFGDILFRNQELVSSGNITSSRNELINSVVKRTMKDSPFFGVGQSRVYPSTDEISRLKDSKSFSYSIYSGAPHNVWILVLCEYGIIGLIGLITTFILIICQLKLSAPSTWAVILCFIILFNTEAIIIHDQSFLLLCLLITSAKRYSEINRINKLKNK